MQHLTITVWDNLHFLKQKGTVSMDKKYYNVPLAISASCVDGMGENEEECEDRGLESIELTEPIEFICIDGSLDKEDYDCIRAELYDYEKEAKQVCFVFDSGGGSTTGLLSLANQIRDYPYKTLAFVDGMCCSAAYMLASACDKIVVTKDSELGSIGVLAVLADITELDKSMGVEFTVIRSREAKSLYNPHEKLSKETVDTVMAKLNAFDAIFYDFVETSRAIDITAVEALNGGTVLATEAKSLGLCDDIIDYLSKYLQSVQIQPVQPQTTTQTTTEVLKMEEKKIDYAALERERIVGIMEVGAKLKMSNKSIESAIKRGDSLEASTAMFMAIREELDAAYSPPASQQKTQLSSSHTTSEPKEFAGGRLSITDLLASIGG